MPDGEGYVTVAGTAGTVNPDDVVFLLNDDTGHSVLALVATDGSFTARLLAGLSDKLIVIVRDRAENQTRVEVGPFLRRDPITGEVLAAVVRQAGGSVERDGIRLDVPLGAMPGAAEVSVSRVIEPFTLPEDIAASPSAAAAFASVFRPVARVRLDADIRRFAGPVKLTIAAPAGAVVGDLYLVVRSRQVTVGGVLADLDRITGLSAADNPIRAVERLEILDSATVKSDQGRLVLSTDSPPFDGLLEPDVLTFLQARGPVTFLTGEVRRDSGSGRAVEGAIVRSLPDAHATSPFVAVTKEGGRFVLADAAAGGPHEMGAVVSSRLDVFDAEFSRFIRRDVTSQIGMPAPPSVTVGYLNEPFVLPTRLPRELHDVLGDLEPPSITITIQGPGLRDGFAFVDQPLTATVSVQDNDEVVFLSLQVNVGGGYEDVDLDGTASYRFVPRREMIVRFLARARDRSGNSTTRELLLRTVDPDDDDDFVVTSLPAEPPEWIPPPLWNPPCTFDGERLPRFTEPLDPETVDVGTVRMVDPDGRPVAITVEVDKRDGTLVRIRPKRNLRFDSTYEIRIASSVRDLDGQAIPHEVRIVCHVPPPVQVATIPLANAQDVALKDDGTLVAINHPIAAVNAETAQPGRLHTFRVRDKDGNFLAQPESLGSVEVSGRPLSLAVDGNRAYIGNRYLGDAGSAQAIFSPMSMLGGLGFGGFLGGGALGAMFPVTWTDFPSMPSNLQVIDITDPAVPKSVGMKELNHLTPLDENTWRASPTLWNPNTFPIRTLKTRDGIGVVNSYNNLELLSADDVPESRNIIERVDGPMVFPGRCQGGPNDGMACTISHLDPFGTLGRLQCGGSSCQRHDEFLNAAFLDETAITLDREGVRIVTTEGDRPHHLAPSDRTLGTLELGGTGLGQVEAVEGFEWEGVEGQETTMDLAFVSGLNDRLTILNVTKPSFPEVLSSIELPSGFMAIDECSGVLYLHSRRGSFHAIDFNDAKNPLDLNVRNGVSAFQMQGPEGTTAYRSLAFARRTLHAGGARGLVVVRLGDSEAPIWRKRPTCRALSLDWQTLKNDERESGGDRSNPVTYGGGFRVFPDQQEPDGAPRSRVPVRLTVDGISSRGAHVYLRLMDMHHYARYRDCNYIIVECDFNGGDNLSAGGGRAKDGGAVFEPSPGVRIEGLLAATFVEATSTGGPTSVDVMVRLDARQPGNNWRVVAAVCDGAEPNCAERSRLEAVCVVRGEPTGRIGESCGDAARTSALSSTSLLTVWRYLRVSAIGMKYPTKAQLSNGPGRARIASGAVLSNDATSVRVVVPGAPIGGEQPDQFAGGRITLNDRRGFQIGTFRVVKSETGASPVIDIESMLLPGQVESFGDLVDDDLVEEREPLLTPDELMPDIESDSGLSWRRILSPALVEPKLVYIERELEFEANVSEGVVASSVCGHRDLSRNANDFWEVCVVAMNQYLAGLDGDSSSTGNVHTGWSSGPVSYLFVETIRDFLNQHVQEPATMSRGDYRRYVLRQTAAHEMLHSLGLEHDGLGRSRHGAIMRYGTTTEVREGVRSPEDMVVSPEGVWRIAALCKPGGCDGPFVGRGAKGQR